MNPEKALEFVKAHINVVDETGAKQAESKAVVAAWIETNLRKADLRLLSQFITVTLGRVEDGAVYIKSCKMVPVLEGSPASYAVTNSGAVLSGGNGGCSLTSHRNALYKFLFKEVLSLPIALELPERFRVSARDVISLSNELTLIGSSYWTNEDAIRSMLQANVFGSKKVAVVRDLFDRHLKLRPFLDSILFALDSSSTIAVLDTVLGTTNTKRRLVQEYTYSDDGSYKLTVNDMELGQYLTHTGFKTLSVPASIVSGPISLFAHSNNKFITYASQAKLVEFYKTEAPKIDPKFASFEFVVLPEEDDSSTSYLELLASALVTRVSSVAPPALKKDVVAKELAAPNKPFAPYRDTTPRQTTNKLLMVAPIGFLSSAQTALDNYFMNTTQLEPYEVERLALAEYVRTPKNNERKKKKRGFAGEVPKLQMKRNNLFHHFRPSAAIF